MTRGLSWSLLAPLVLAGLISGCRFDVETRDPWRAEAEEQCLAEGGVTASAFMEPLSAINGSGECGMEHPFQVHAFSNGDVVMEPTGKLACPVIRKVNLWISDTVEPAAMAWFGQKVVAIRQMSAYSCRTMNGQAGAKISEHAFGNALDVGAFRLEDGRWITVKNGWKGSTEERGFLLQVQAGACQEFTTVLAPGSNAFHYDHIHVDLMRHGKGRMICKPQPRPLPAPMVVKAPASDLPPRPAPARYPVSDPAPEPQAQPQPQPQPAPFWAAPPWAAPRPAAPPPAPPPQAEAPQVETLPAPQIAAPSAPEIARPADLPPRPAQDLPPGWQVGPQGQSPGPMSYAPTRGGDPQVTGSVPTRKYYTAPVPQASPLPLPKAKPGED